MQDKIANEAQAVLEQVNNEHCGFSEAAWFTQEIMQRFQVKNLKNEKPELIILGEDFPPELALAVCDDPYFLLGGSLETTHWSDSLLPRDADPVSRSACGWLLNKHFHLAEDALIVLTLTNDNRRKLAGLLQGQGLQVLPIDLPPIYQSEQAKSSWVDEMLRATREMAAYCYSRITVRSLVRSIMETQRLRQAILSFQKTVLKTPACMSPTLRGIILESVYYTENRTEWLRHLQRLTGQIITWQRRYYVPQYIRPWVLTVGSPVMFPNEKLPMLLESSGLFLASRVDPLSIQPEMPTPSVRRFDTLRDLLMRMAAERLAKEVSGAWTVNYGLLDAVQHRLDHMPIDGIVYHVLKGQIEYDFELSQVEKIASEYGVPVFRLETDYQQQDVEQLRIRMEAFSEMLQQRNSERIWIAQ